MKLEISKKKIYKIILVVEIIMWCLMTFALNVCDIYVNSSTSNLAVSHLSLIDGTDFLFGVLIHGVYISDYIFKGIVAITIIITIIALAKNKTWLSLAATIGQLFIMILSILIKSYTIMDVTFEKEISNVFVYGIEWLLPLSIVAFIIYI